jgi:molybdenum cofactor guanylyltransferase
MSAPIARHAITGVILCGGDGRRMGGVDKPLLLLGGRPLVAHVHTALAPHVSRIVVSANRNRESYAPYGDVVADRAIGRGPLEGVASALAQVDTPWAFCCPGDSPRFDGRLVTRLAAAIDDGDAAYPSDGLQPQYLFLLLRTALRAELEAWLESGGRAVHRFLATRKAVAVDASDLAPAFLNVNEPADLQAP